MDHRKALLDRLEALDAIDEDHFPVVTLDEYFTGNTQEQSIAPNQWGDGRPSIADIHARFRQVEARADVVGVFVGLHQDWSESLDDDTWPAAENIHVISSAPQEIADEWVVGLASDGISTGKWPYGKHKAAPEVPAGFQLYTVYWD
jgi:hypothetical protein